MFRLFSVLVALLTVAVMVKANPTPGLIPLLDPILDLGASDPPRFLQTVKPSPQCANINQGELQCCRGTLAGDQQLVVWLAKVYGYRLNPNDVNGVNCASARPREPPSSSLTFSRRQQHRRVPRGQGLL